MADYENKTFENQTVILDANTYRHCRFEKCTIVYEGGTLPQLHDVHFSNSLFAFDGAAQRTLTYLWALNRTGAGNVIKGLLNEILTAESPEG